MSSFLGIIQPNDGKCHMENGQYTHDLIQDYPSISQIRRLAIDNLMWIIFAVPQERVELYNLLSDEVVQSKTGILTNDSSNILEIVESLYRVSQSSNLNG